MTDHSYSITWRDKEGKPHSQAFEARSASHAIIQAMEQIELLRSNPNLITRVLQNHDWLSYQQWRRCSSFRISSTELGEPAWFLLGNPPWLLQHYLQLSEHWVRGSWPRPTRYLSDDLARWWHLFKQSNPHLWVKAAIELLSRYPRIDGLLVFLINAFYWESEYQQNFFFRLPQGVFFYDFFSFQTRRAVQSIRQPARFCGNPVHSQWKSSPLKVEIQSTKFDTSPSYTYI